MAVLTLSCVSCRDYIFYVDYISRCVYGAWLGLCLVGIDWLTWVVCVSIEIGLCDCSSDEAVNDRLKSNLEEFALWVKDLGTYSSSIAKANVEPPRWKNLCSVISC